MRRLFCVLAIFGLMLAMGSPARADSISFDLSTIANDLGGGTTPAADLVLVTVTTGVLGGTNCPGGISTTTCVEVEFAPDTAKGSTLADVPSPVLININGDFAASSSAGLAGGVGGYDQFGTMSLETGAPTSPTITIYLKPIDGNSWASAANVLIPTCPGGTAATPGVCGGFDLATGLPIVTGGYNTSSYSHGFEAEVGFYRSGTDSGDDAELAGYYVPTPEPMSLLLLGGCLLVVGRKLSARQA